ncbi:unnamed protein product [Rhodiola kirilowii]
MAASLMSSLPPQPSKPPDPSHVDESLIPPQAAKLSFAAATSKPLLQPRFQPIPLSSRQYGQVDGKPTVYFTTAEFDAGAALFRHSLIAKFTLGRPSIAEIRTVFKENWRITGRATISEIYDGRHLMIILDSEDDAKIALTSPIRKVGHSMFRLFRYTPDYSPRRESTTTTKWVRLSGLHPAFFTRNYVAGIVNVFGEFLDLDVRTKACSSLKYARACVEVDVSKAILEEVILTLSDGRKFSQKIEVEGNLSYCSYCKIHGHMLTECRKKRKVSGEVNLSSESMIVVDSGKDAALNMKMVNTVQRETGKEGKANPPVDDQEGWTEVKRKKSDRTVIELDKGKISSNDLTNKDLTTQDEESIDPASAMILYNEQDDNILLPDLYLTNVGGQFYCEQLGGKIFQDQEEFAKFAEENGYVQEDSTIPIEELEYEVPEVIHNSANQSCDQVEYVDPSPMTRTRQRKKKGHRSSARSCPKKKDKNFVYS